MDEREQLILNMEKVEGNKYELNEDENIFEYVNLMLKYIGDSQPKLRDELIRRKRFKRVFGGKWMGTWSRCICRTSTMSGM